MKKCMMILFLICLLSRPVSAELRHRYDFTEDPNDVIVGLGSTLVGDAYIDGGVLVLDGDGDWLEMDAAGIAINTYTTGLTLELWSRQPTDNQGFSMTASLGDTWGNGYGRDYVNIATTRGDDVSRAGIANTPDDDAPWDDEVWVDGPELNDDLEHHYVLSVDDPTGTGIGTLSYYIDGELQGTTDLAGTTISGLSNAAAYLGRGTYSVDGQVFCWINEFRIHDKGLNEAEVRFTNFFGSDDADHPIVIRSMTPVYGKTLVSRTPTLAWTPEASVDVDTYTLYFGTDPNLIDPNVADAGAASLWVAADLETGSYPITTALKYDTNYYWRVDTVALDSTVYQGVGSVFTTIPESPVIITQPADWVVADGSGTSSAVFTVVSGNSDTWAWYKEGDPNPLVNGAKYAGADTESLTILNVDMSDEGRYYCEISDTGLPGVVVNTPEARGNLLTKRLVGWWKLDGDLVDAVDTVVSGAATHDGVFEAGTGGVETYDVGAGDAGQGAVFAGTADTRIAIDPANQADFNFFARGFTASVWVKTTQNNWRLPFSKLEAPTSGWLFGVNTGTNTTFQFIVEGRGGFASSSEVDVRDGNWHMVTALYDPDALQLRMYVDGTHPTTMNMDLSTYNALANVAPVQIGGRIGETSINGMVDEARIYSYPLSADEVAQLYYETMGEFCQFKPVYDYNDDCRVTLADVEYLLAEWLECGTWPISACP